jgi:anti-sigma factor RsiW
VEIVQHVSEDDLERYAMRFLPAPESEQLEEHLLICAECRDRLEATDECVATMKAAAAKIREIGTGE